MEKADSTNMTLYELQRSLKNKLNPVQPDKKFIGHLRERLETSSGNYHQQRLAMQLMTTAVGLMAGLIIFLVGQHLIKKNG
jgi:hypothetical protein